MLGILRTDAYQQFAGNPSSEDDDEAPSVEKLDASASAFFNMIPVYALCVIFIVVGVALMYREAHTVAVARVSDLYR